jgi:threonine/homoserine/homoserine lactone efflux protein
MASWMLLKGMGLGLAIAAPVGPIGLLCIRRSLTQGQRMGLVTGLGAATADGIYGCIAGFGLTAVADVLVAQAQGLQLVGGLFLCYLGVSTLRADPATEAAQVSSRGQGRALWGAYVSTLCLTLTNPATILSFIAIFAGLGIVGSGQSWSASLALVVGVFLGSALWWLCLSWGVTVFSQRLTAPRLKWLNRLAGAAIFAFGVAAVVLALGGQA